MQQIFRILRYTYTHHLSMIAIHNSIKQEQNRNDWVESTIWGALAIIIDIPKTFG